MKRTPIRITAPGASYEIRVVGARRHPMRDLYHALMRISWTATFTVLGGLLLVANLLFAVGFAVVGGVAHAHTLVDAFFFSVQTMGTIGYGAMYPESAAANALVTVESMFGLAITALFTGLVFAKFSRPTARLTFTRQAVISPTDGVPTLAFRLSNERGNQIVDAHIRVVMIRTERTLEGATFYRMLDLRLTRERALSLSRSWSVQHKIDEESPLHGMTPARMLADEVELQVMVVGLDDTSMQPVHASHRYFADQVLWGARHADILSEDGDVLTLDLDKFHDVEATVPTPVFPYPQS